MNLNKPLKNEIDRLSWYLKKVGFLVIAGSGFKGNLLINYLFIKLWQIEKNRFGNIKLRKTFSFSGRISKRSFSMETTGFKI